MEVIKLSGYIAAEKREIAKQYLLPRQIEKGGLKAEDLNIDVTTLDMIIDGYARDAGVRKLEKQLSKIVRKVIVKILEGTERPVTIKSEELVSYLGTPVFRDERSFSGAGVVTGLAWTAQGGATLNVEAIRGHNFARGFKFTGQLGDVMKESAEIAYSYIFGHAEQFGVNPEFFKEAFIHLHVPAGATPKDGPSAGITIASALLSLALNKPVRHIAMTGELTLTGEVFPIGGVREKLIAARRANIQEIILPDENRGEYNEVPDHVRDGLKINFVNQFTDVVALIF
jgi:ATP-dependent Lon protease